MSHGITPAKTLSDTYLFQNAEKTGQAVIARERIKKSTKINKVR